MDQPTREQLLHAEAAKYGIAPDVIDRAVGVIAAVQRRDRADFRKNFGGELTPTGGSPRTASPASRNCARTRPARLASATTVN